MSEKIKITIVVDDEETHIKRVVEIEKKAILTQDSSMTLMSVLLEKRLIDGGFCGGRGDCGRCIVHFLEGAPLPTGLERGRLTPEELRQGYRLACMTRLKGDCVIRIVGVEETEPKIVTEVKLPSENIDLNSRQNNLSEIQKATAMESGVEQDINLENTIKKTPAILKTEAGVMQSSEKWRGVELKESERYVIAVDLGTTTIAMQLRNVETGETSDTYCERNPQRIYGTDVLSRIRASCAGRREELRRLVCGTLLRGLGQFAAYLRERGSESRLTDDTGVVQGLEKVVCMCIAGNTTMEHLLLGYDVETLGRAPFVPVETGLQELSLVRLFSDMEDFSGEMGDVSLWRAKFPVYIVPCISAFVGGDIVAGLYALRMFSDFAGHSTEPYAAVETVVGKGDGRKTVRGIDSRAVLLIDLGTNGEMVIMDGNHMIATATAAGPAFEGDGILIGTDRIAFAAELLRGGILDETGLLSEPYFTEGVCINKEKENRKQIKSECYFKQKDMRDLQMAKAAVRAGVEILWDEMGQPEIERIYLAGGFGYYLDVEAAVAIGLLPSRMRGRVMAAGNTSLAGAYEIGRDLYRKGFETALLEERVSSITSINLARRKNFESLYLKYMNLEEN